jgi:hypothetical protein
VLCLTAALAVGCSDDQWEDFVQPVYQYAGTHPSLQGCRKMAIAVLTFLHAVGKGDYECGKNCRWVIRPGAIEKVCEIVSR